MGVGRQHDQIESKAVYGVKGGFDLMEGKRKAMSSFHELHSRVLLLIC